MEKKTLSGIESVPAAGEPGGLPADLVLDKGGPLTPSKLAKIAGRRVVRYDTDGKQVCHWLKHKRDTSRLLKALETIVHSSSKLT